MIWSSSGAGSLLAEWVGREPAVGGRGRRAGGCCWGSLAGASASNRLRDCWREDGSSPEEEMASWRKASAGDVGRSLGLPRLLVRFVFLFALSSLRFCLCVYRFMMSSFCLHVSHRN